MHRPVDNSLAWRLWLSIAALLLHVCERVDRVPTELLPGETTAPA